MKIGIFDPYLDTLGGGERYIFMMAACLANDHHVSFFWEDEEIIKNAEKKFYLNLQDIHIAENIFNPSTSFTEKVMKTAKFDRIVYMSDGSFPLLFAKKNFLLFQSPMNWVNGRSFPYQLKLQRITDVIVYSDFVKQYIDKTFRVHAKVIAPAIEIENTDTKKEDIILSVGRFTLGMNTKKQEMLVETFKKRYKEEFKNWKLVIIGSVLPGDIGFVARLKEKAKGYPIEIITDASYKTLVDYYHKAKIYWHAAGFGEDLHKHPEKAEHFGMTTVEAMACRAVPVVINAGGQKEIVEDGKNGFLWNTQDELIDKTKKIIENQSLFNALSVGAGKRAKDFSQDIFCKNVQTILQV